MTATEGQVGERKGGGLHGALPNVCMTVCGGTLDDPGTVDSGLSAWSLQKHATKEFGLSIYNSPQAFIFEEKPDFNAMYMCCMGSIELWSDCRDIYKCTEACCIVQIDTGNI